VELAIAEEKGKVTKINTFSESVRSVPKSSEKTDADEDFDQLRNERNDFFDQLVIANHKVGELETKLLRLEFVADSIVQILPDCNLTVCRR
jgi:hypothetical protein